MKYEEPRLEVLCFQTKDIITTSSEMGDEDQKDDPFGDEVNANEIYEVESIREIN